jgi:hypothetical protein
MALTPRLDDAQEQFEETLNAWSAQVYRDVAQEYLNDGMIGKNEMAYIRKLTAPYLEH